MTRPRRETTPKEYFTGTEGHPRTWTVCNPGRPARGDAVLVGQSFQIQERAGGSDQLRVVPLTPLGDRHWRQVRLRYFRVDGGTVRGIAADNGNFVVISRRRPGENGRDRIHCTVITGSDGQEEPHGTLRLEAAGEWDAEDDGG